MVYRMWNFALTGKQATILTYGSRLQQAADILGVAVPFFFEGSADGPFKSNGRDPPPAYIDDFVGSEDGQRIIKAFMRIRPALRHRIVTLVNELAGERGS
jgi:hypothetical protein